MGSGEKRAGQGDGKAPTIDRKTSRRIHSRQLPGAHLMAARAHQTGTVVGRPTVEVKRNDLAALHLLLVQLELTGKEVTQQGQVN